MRTKSEQKGSVELNGKEEEEKGLGGKSPMDKRRHLCSGCLLYQRLQTPDRCQASSAYPLRVLLFLDMSCQSPTVVGRNIWAMLLAFAQWRTDAFSSEILPSRVTRRRLYIFRGCVVRISSLILLAVNPYPRSFNLASCVRLLCFCSLVVALPSIPPNIQNSRATFKTPLAPSSPVQKASFPPSGSRPVVAEHGGDGQSCPSETPPQEAAPTCV
ncbi:hypothetical protein BV25DRAFT_801219 [Artomyces pyxidatus]|uniref:Uncharacterized protein n=1 Tax=Artomyces pyxidatus TaxID=48021 RepID=A0ACB8SYW7_9AGAM|nr:hypothetical protein BV25DRAFT_801219 [Artomyces pyxidatus]